MHDGAEHEGATPAPASADRADAPSSAIAVQCLRCGSHRLDTSAAPRGNEIVQCLRCGDWNSYFDLERAAVESIRESLERRKVLPTSGD